MMPKLYWALASNSASICSAQCLFSLLSTSDWHSTCRCSKRKPNSNSLSTMHNFQAWMPALSQLKVRGAAIILVGRNQRPRSRNASMELLSFQLLSTMQEFCGAFLDRILSMDLVSKYFKADLQVLLIQPSLAPSLQIAVPRHVMVYPACAVPFLHHSCTWSCISSFKGSDYVIYEKDPGCLKYKATSLAEQGSHWHQYWYLRISLSDVTGN